MSPSFIACSNGMGFDFGFQIKNEPYGKVLDLVQFGGDGGGSNSPSRRWSQSVYRLRRHLNFARRIATDDNNGRLAE